jgi:hypothetical protein
MVLERLLQLSDGHIRLLAEIGRKTNIRYIEGFDNGVTSRSQTSCTPFTFYVNSGVLKRFGLIKSEPVKEHALVKLWTITPKGALILKHFNNIEKILRSDGNVRTD